MNLSLPDAPQERIKALTAELTKAVVELELQHAQNGSGAPERWVTTAEACAYLRITRDTIQRYKRAGKLHPAQIGRGNRYSMRELEAFPRESIKGAGEIKRW